jgi:hypothetical protein
MLRALYGSFKIVKKTDYLKLLFKIVYIIYTSPFLLFALLLYARSFGAFNNSPDEKFGKIKIFLLHFSAIAFSFGIWIILSAVLEDNFGIKIRLHLF